jgi:hypothetical protein
MQSTRFLALAGLAAALGLTPSCSTTQHAGGAGGICLFNGKNLTGWHAATSDAAVPASQVWSVRDGMIVCRGEPIGWLSTDRIFTNFCFEVEYRWAPGAKPGNSGLFSRVNGPSRGLPRCVEVQLHHGDAGDVMGLQGMKIAGGVPRFFHVDKHAVAGDIDGVKKTTDAEAAPGQWNKVGVQAEGGRYTVWVNGQKVNEVDGVEAGAGPLGLQSEGGEVHFRNVMVTPLP